jgi:hypothetical protein
MNNERFHNLYSAQNIVRMFNAAGHGADVNSVRNVGGGSWRDDVTWEAKAWIGG